MIVGHGNVASAIEDRNDVLFFASGVSNSAETDVNEFARERNLLMAQDKNMHLVYFSSLSIYRDRSAYNVHKILMEGLVKTNFTSYTIVRVEVIAWGRNPTTIHNVFRRKLAAGEPITLQSASRYILKKDEFRYWLELIPVGMCNEMNIPGIKYDVIDILKMVKEGEL